MSREGSGAAESHRFRDFSASLLSIQESPPERLPRVVLYSVAVLIFALILWACLGRLDIIASAEGRLIPQSYVKIVQPADAGSVESILVSEGEHVHEGQLLMRMDARDAAADETSLRNQEQIRALQLRRIDAELSDHPIVKLKDDPEDLYARVSSQYQDRRQAYLDALAQAQAAEDKASHEYESAKATLVKLQQIIPLLKDEAESYQEMGKEGYAPRMAVDDKQRDYVEKSEELKSQEWTVRSLESALSAARKQVAETTSKYHSDLQNERMDAEGDIRKVQQELVKQRHKGELLELKAPQAGIVKDLATHTVGTVVQPGTVLLSLVPENEPLIAEVTVRNDDVGFVYAKQSVKLKVAPYPFEQYGLIDGSVSIVEPDSDTQSNSDKGGSGKRADDSKSDELDQQQSGYKALIALKDQTLVAQGKPYPLVAGMQVTAEINQGTRTVMEYLLSPVARTLHDSGRER